MGAGTGFQQVGITDTDLSESEPKLQHGWTNNTTAKWTGWRVTVCWCSSSRIIARYAARDQRADEYLPANAAFASTLKNPKLGYVAVMRWAVTITSFCATDSKSWRDDSATLCFAEF